MEEQNQTEKKPMDFLELQKKVIWNLEIQPDYLKIRLDSITSAGKSWSLNELGTLAAQNSLNSGSELLSKLMNTHYREFMNLHEPNLEEMKSSLKEEIKESGWVGIINTFQDLMEVSNAVGHDPDYVWSVLAGEDPKKLAANFFTSAL